MALDISYKPSAALSLKEALAKLDAVPVGLEKETERIHGATVLAGLYANRDFLADAAVDALKASYKDDLQGAREYGPQVITLGAPRSGWFLRANIWPAESDYAVRASGKDAFFYGLPHDHNFDFLTIGYHGPGYISDYYEQDYAAISGYPGEDAALSFVERSALFEGHMLYYRKHVDVHCQHPPEQLSISLNLMITAPEQYWFDQCRYDVERNVVENILSQGANEALLHIALAAGADNGRDIVMETLRHHPADRMRMAALRALADNSAAPSDRRALLEDYMQSDRKAVSGYARHLADTAL